MDRFLRKMHLEMRYLEEGGAGAYLTADAYKRECSKVEDVHYS